MNPHAKPAILDTMHETELSSEFTAWLDGVDRVQGETIGLAQALMPVAPDPLVVLRGMSDALVNLVIQHLELDQAQHFVADLKAQLELTEFP